MIVGFRNILFIILVSLFVTAGAAQERFAYNADAEQQFSLAVKLYKQSDFIDAAKLCDALVQLEPIHQRTTAAYLMSAKAHVELKEYQVAVPLLTRFLEKFPQSSYAEDAHFTLALAHMKLNENVEAMLEFIRVAEISDDKKFYKQSLALIDTIISPNLAAGTIQDILSQAKNRDVKDLLTLKVAEKVLEKNDYNQAKELAGKITAADGKYSKRAKQLLRQIAREERVVVKIGVMLPLMKKTPLSPFKKSAEEILNGILFATQQTNDDTLSQIKIELEVRDTEHDSLLARQAILEFASDKDILAILGPMFSDIAFACAPVANEKHIPMISPTANALGITSGGTYVIQLNPDLEVFGKAIARHAVENLKLQTLAVLAPNDTTLRPLISSFVNEARTLCANVVAVETYGRDLLNLKGQFMNIRSAALFNNPMLSLMDSITQNDIAAIESSGVSHNFFDSLISTDTVTTALKLFGIGGRRLVDSLNLNKLVLNFDVSKLENTVTSLDGIFVPIIDADQIGVVASQAVYYNMPSQLLGSAEWYDPGQLDMHKRYTGGVIFCSDSYVDQTSHDYQKFEREYSARMSTKDGLPKTSPSKYTLFGYDAMKLLAKVIADGARTRDEIAQSLAAVQNVRGLHTTFTFDERRVNSVIHILKYHRGAVKKVGEITVKP